MLNLTLDNLKPRSHVTLSTPDIPVAVSGFLAKRHGLLIDGEWTEGSGELETRNPATDEIIARVAAGGLSDIDRAVRAARAAFDSGPWSRMKPAERAKLIWRVGDLLEAHAHEFALIETLDNGKPMRDALAFDIPHAVELFRYNAGWSTKLGGEQIALSNPGEWHAYTVREPLGVVGLIVPWNAPLMMAAAKLAPALAAGCTVILKPAEETPLSALRLGELFQAAGFPRGVVNIVTGTGEAAGAAIVDHTLVDKISFTGSTEVGRAIVRRTADSFKRVTLELGGKTPFIIFPDADLDRAIPAAARSIFGNAGQVCNAGSRLFAHRDVFDAVIDRLADRALSLRVGPGIEPETEMGPLISGSQLDRVQGYVASGRAAGATLAAGGSRLDRPGHFLDPTILVGTTREMDVVQQEIFGPVLCAMSFERDELNRIAEEANSTRYGLGAVIWTRDLHVAHEMTRLLKAGTVRVNGGGLDPALPFGGFKESGWGRESGRAGIEAYTELKSVAISF